MNQARLQMLLNKLENQRSKLLIFLSDCLLGRHPVPTSQMPAQLEQRQLNRLQFGALLSLRSNAFN